MRHVAVLSGQAAWKGLEGVYNSDDLTHAASIAYYALLSLFPFLLLLISVLGSITADEADRTAVLTFIFRYLPTHFDFVSNQLDQLRERPLRLGVAGGAVLVWTSLGVFGAISTAVNHAWGVEKQRSYLRHKLVSFLMMVAASALLLLTLVLGSAAQVARASWVPAQFPALLALQGFAVRYAALFLLILSLGLVFYFIPNAKVRFRDVWVGAVLTGILWQLAFAGFAWYVRDMQRFSIHGSLGAVVVFMFWVYVSAVILLYGVEFTAAYGRLRRRRPDEIPAAPAPRV